jgi:hypothetical protein
MGIMGGRRRSEKSAEIKNLGGFYSIIVFVIIPTPMTFFFLFFLTATAFFFLFLLATTAFFFLFLLATTAFFLFLLAAVLAVIPVVHVLASRPAISVLVDILIFAGIVIKTPF